MTTYAFDRGGKQIEVTPAQVKAAKLIVERAKASKKTPDAAVVAIASAKVAQPRKARLSAQIDGDAPAKTRRRTASPIRATKARRTVAKRAAKATTRRIMQTGSAAPAPPRPSKRT